MYNLNFLKEMYSEVINPNLIKMVSSEINLNLDYLAGRFSVNMCSQTL